MANKKISSLGSLGGTPDVADIIPITDVSDTTGSVNGTTKKVTVANLVAAAPQGDLVASNNLSDVASASTARTNLGLGTAASQDVGTANGNLVQLDSTGLPAIDGSQLTNLPAGSLFNTIVSESTTARTLSDSDCGKVIDCSNGSAVTITIPSTVSAGFNCTVVQSGAGQVTIAAGASVNLYCYSSTKATAGQYAAINIIPYASNSYVLEGDLAASGGGGAFSNTYSLDLDGTNDYVDIGGSYDLGTFSAWFKPDNVLSASQSPYMIAGFTGVGTYPNNGGILVSGHVTGTLSNEIITLYTGDWNYAYTNGSATISNTDWHHLAVHWSGSDYEIYLDGTQVKNAQSQFGTLSKAKIPITNLILGKRVDNNYMFPSLIDEVAIWSTPISSIASLRDTSGTNPVPADISSLSPNGYWRMGDTGSDYGTSTITDAGSGGTNGALTNGPTFSTDVPT
jgi:hypothetical protein